jgi:hypothetical protein
LELGGALIGGAREPFVADVFAAADGGVRLRELA